MPRTTFSTMDTGTDSYEYHKPGEDYPKEYPVGSVVYYLHKDKNDYDVEFGLAVANYEECVLLEKLTLRDRRLVDGIPYKDFPSYTEWRKLPEEFDWDNQVDSVCKRELAPLPQGYEYVDVHNPEAILQAFQDGRLIKVSQYDQTHLTVELDARHGYRLRKTGNSKYPDMPKHVGIEYSRCYPTWAEAEKHVEEYRDDVYRQMTMSEHEWNVQEMQCDVDWWANVNHITPEERQKAVDFFLGMKDFDEIETSVMWNALVWKKWKNKKWEVYGTTEPLERVLKFKSDGDWIAHYGESASVRPFDEWNPEETE